MHTYSPGDEPIPGYRLIEQLGQGSFGVVWQAEGPGGVLVAMKVISNLNGIHAIREWQSLQNVMNLRQANLVEIYGVWLKNEENRVLRADEVRALIPPEADVAVPVTETSLAPTPPPRKAVWAGDKRGAKPSPAPHKLEGATLQPEEEPETARPISGSTGIAQSGSGESPSAGTHESDATKGTGSAKEGTGSKGSSGAKDAAASGSRGKWSKVGGVPPLELVSAMTLGEGTLMSRLKQCQGQSLRGIPRPELLRYMVEAAKGLGYLNDRKMHHCDVKPENLLLVGGSVKVCDYGSALRTIYSAEARTHQGYTEQYAAPEQLSGRKVKLHASTDMYALALTYYALRTGKYPWGDLSTEPIAVVKYGEKFDFSALANQSRYPYEWQVIRKALKRDPEDRYPSTLEFVEALDNAARREEEATRARRRRRIRNAVLLVVAMLLVGAGIGGWLNRDKLPSWVSLKSSEDQFKALVGGSPDELIRSIDVVNGSRKAIDAKEVSTRVSEGIDRTVKNSADDLSRVLDKVLTLKEPYRDGLKVAVVNSSSQVFQRKHLQQIAKHEYAPALSAVKDDVGLQGWNLTDEVGKNLVDQWLQVGQAKLVAADRDPAKATEGARPLAALASAVADDSQRQSEIDGVVSQQLGAWLAAAEASLRKEAEFPQARDEFRWVAAAADSYLQARLGEADEIHSQGAEARLGELAARFRLAKENPADLVKALAGISAADLKPSSSAQARRILFARALGPPDDVELVSDRFLNEELPKLRALPPGWEQQAVINIKKSAVAVAQKQHELGQLVNIDAVLMALEDDGLTLELVRDALAGAANAADEPAFRQALEQAGRRLSPLPQKLEQPADELARAALQSWLALMTSDAPTPAQMTGAVQAFEQWDASGSGDTRATAWYADFVESLARRRKRWPPELLSAAIDELESDQANRARRIDRHFAALALRSQRLLTLALQAELTDQELAQIEQDSQRLVAARDDEDDGQLVGRLIEPPVLVDALWAESQLAPLALASMAGSAIPAEIKGALERVTTYLKDQPAAGGADDQDAIPYVRYVADLHRAIARPPGDDLEDAFLPPAEGNAWLAAPRRHAVAAALLLDLAEQAARTPAFHRETDLANSSTREAFARQLPRLKRAQGWATSGTKQQIAADARAALALFYSTGERDWSAIRSATDGALADRQACQAVVSREQYSNLLLASAQAMRNQESPVDASAVLGLLAEVLRRECDPHDGGQGCLADLALYSEVVEPAIELIDNRLPAKNEADGPAVATIFGSQGALLERDSARLIARTHYKSAKDPEVYDPDLYFSAMLQAFQKSASLEPEPELRLRWLAGEAYAVDARAEFEMDKNPPSGAEKYDQLCKTLEEVLQRMRQQSRQPEYFAIAGIEGLVASYRAQDFNELGKPQEEQRLCADAYASLRKAIGAVEADPKGKSPWCGYWHSAYVTTLSQVCLQQSWDTPWGSEHQRKVQEAIALAKAAANDQRGSAAARCRGLIALGSACEDYALHLGCVDFFQPAQDAFAKAQEEAGGDPYLRLRAEGEMQRVLMRRHQYDLRRAPLGGQDFTKLTADMEDVRDRMELRDLAGSARNLSFWLGEAYRRLAPGDANARSQSYAKAEKIFADLAKHSAGEKKAKRLRIAADCALAQAKASAANQLANRQALDSAQKYLDQLDSQEQFLISAEDRRRLVDLRLDVWSFDNGAESERYQKLDELVTASLGRTKGMAAEQRTMLEFALAKSKFDVAIKSPAHRNQASEAVQACRQIWNRAKADKLWRSDELARSEIQLLSLEAFYLWSNPPVDPAARSENSWQVYLLVKRMIEAADKLEQEMGVLKCCAAEGEPTIGQDVKGYSAAVETATEREFCARLLTDPIRKRGAEARARGDTPTFESALRELNWIKSMLEDTQSRLPPDVVLKGRITANYLPDVKTLISRLSQQP